MTRAVPRADSPEAEPTGTPQRDMDATAFAAILAELVKTLPGAYAAALVDGEGETVDYVGVAPPFDIRVAAAHVRLLLVEIERYAVLGVPRWLMVCGAHRTLAARALPEGYALVVLFAQGAVAPFRGPAFEDCARALAREAGWAH